jgi:predicted TIM-barrel fold metal-dependent hydrolase
MMDLGPWFEGSPPPGRALAQQASATCDLVLRHPGRIHPFASFDPRREVRDGDALALVEQGLAAGMIGVKIYPPLGYRPWGNAELPDTPADPRPADAASWDAALAELYDYCAANDVPIAAHCSNPGAEARPGRGLNADPAYWRPVLERYRDRGTPLRINFNHAGGLAELLERPEESWAWTLGRLIEDEGHELVFADLGHLDEVLQRESRARLAQALGAYFERFPRVKQRLMFGTDWHMLVRRPAHRDYLREQARFIAEFFPEMQADFLGQNALRYLGLEPGLANWLRLDAFYQSHGLDRPPWWIASESQP